MMSVLKNIFFIFLALFLTSCASLQQMQQQWVAENCNTQAAYNAGLQAGLTPGARPNPAYLNQCPMHSPQFDTAYLEGFRKGAKSRPTEINVNIDRGTASYRGGLFCNAGNFGPFGADTNPSDGW